MNATGSVMVDDEGQRRLHESAPGGRSTPGHPGRGPDEVAPESESGTAPWHPVHVDADTGQTPRHAPKPPVRRETAMWLVCAGVLAVVAITLGLGAREGALALAVLLLTGSLARAVIPGPGPIGITIRSRGVDVAMFATLGLMIGILAQTAPNI